MTDKPLLGLMPGDMTGIGMHKLIDNTKQPLRIRVNLTQTEL